MAITMCLYCSMVGAGENVSTVKEQKQKRSGMDFWPVM